MQAVFNEDYQTRKNSNVKYSEVYGDDGKTEFFVFHLESSDVEIVTKGEYQIYKINIGQAPGKSYFRFRLVGNGVRDLFSEFEDPSNARLQSAFSSTEIIDFRVNEKRNIDKRFLIADMNKGQFNFIKFHFFFMCSSREDVFFTSHGPVDRCRTLEKEQWYKYININNEQTFLEPNDNKTHILVYQWSIKNKANTHINAMIKTQYEQNNKKTIVRYLFILALITIILNLISNTLFECIKSILEQLIHR
ncbi:MAG: hypothetical protein APF81_05830 [Desulfosporosinus sp. BRH_c37]|nr:MAG: hypothetical protein APF81_05830 [Desulfosporosinus sp. BRH_c37]